MSSRSSFKFLAISGLIHEEFYEQVQKCPASQRLTSASIGVVWNVDNASWTDGYAAIRAALEILVCYVSII